MAKSPALLKEHQAALLVLLEAFDGVCQKLEIPYILFAGSLLGAVRHKGFIPWDDDLDVLMLREDYERLLREAESVLDLEKFFLQKEFSEHWPMFFSKLRMNHTTCLEKFHPKDPQMHQGVYIDIFPCDPAAKTAFGRKLQFGASKIVIAKSLFARGYETDSKAKKLFMQCCRLLPGSIFLKIARAGKKNSEQVHVFLGGSSKYEKGQFPRSCIRQRIMMDFSGRQYPVPEGYDTILKTLYGNYMQLPPEEARITKEHAILVDLENSYEDYCHYRDHMSFAVFTRSIR